MSAGESFRENIRSHGLTPDQHRRLLLDQQGLCAICGRYERLVIDHDHRCCPGRTSCGECVRALLCNRCNTALGLVGDNSEIVSRMLDFLLSQPERKLREVVPPVWEPVPECEEAQEPVPPRVTVMEDIRETLRKATGPLGISEIARRSGRSKAGIHGMIHNMKDVRLTAHGYELKG